MWSYSRHLPRVPIIVTVILVLLLTACAVFSDTTPSYDEFAAYAVLTTNDDLDVFAGTVYGDVGVAPDQEFYISGSSFVDGNVYVSDPGLVTVVSPGWIGGTVTYDTSLAIDDARELSTMLAGMPGTSIPDITGYTTITATGNGYNVYNVGRVDLSDHHVVTLNGGADTWFVFNVSDEFQMSGTPEIELVGGVTADHVIWNITATAETDISGDSLVYGTVLAPDSYVKVNGGEIYGLVVGDYVRLDSDGVVHHVPWEPVPEPGTWVLMMSALGMLGYLKRRRAASQAG